MQRTHTLFSQYSDESSSKAQGMVPFLYDSIERLHILHVAGCYTVLHTRCRHLFGEIEMIGMGHEKVSASKCKSMYGSRTVSACSYYLSLAIDCASIFCASTITVPILNQFGRFSDHREENDVALIEHDGFLD